MTSRLLRPIGDDEVEAFRNDGVVCLRGAFSRDWIERLSAATEEILAQPTQRHIEAPVSAGRFSVDTYVWMHSEAFRDYAFESPAAAIAARLLDARHVSLLYDQVLVKEPGTDTPTSWHQDGASWPLNGEDALTLWMPLDPATVATGGMLYARGQHRGRHYGSYVNIVDVGRAEGLDDEHCPDFEQHEGGRLLLHWDVEPGDCLVHHMWMPHATGGNRSASVRRRAHTTRWVSERCTFREGDFQLRPVGDHGLKEGDPLDGDHFPRVPFVRSWQRQENR